MRDPGPDVPGIEPPDPNEPDAGDRRPGWARRELARAMDRARNPSAEGPAPKSTGNLSEGWRALAQRARRAGRGADEGGATGSVWKRSVKRAMLPILRPVLRRYEALIAELTASGDALAERLEEAEAVVARLSGRRETPGASASPEEPEPSGSTATATNPS